MTTERQDPNFAFVTPDGRVFWETGPDLLTWRDAVGALEADSSLTWLPILHECIKRVPDATFEAWTATPANRQSWIAGFTLAGASEVRSERSRSNARGDARVRGPLTEATAAALASNYVDQLTIRDANGTPLIETADSGDVMVVFGARRCGGEVGMRQASRERVVLPRGEFCW